MSEDNGQDHRFAASRPSQAALPRLAAGGGGRFEPWPYAVVLATLPITTTVAWLLQPIAGLENVDLVFLTAIIAIAVRYGLWPSLFASVASMLAYNFFFIPPLYTFAVAEPTNLAALFFFLVVAMITSHLAARARAEAIAASGRARVTEALYGFSRRITGIATTEELARVAVEQIATTLDLDVMLLLPDERRRLETAAATPGVWPVEPIDLEAVQLAWPEEIAGRHRDVLRLGQRLFLPLVAGGRLVGIVAIAAPGGEEAGPRQAPMLSGEEQRLLSALTGQAAVALERLRLGRERDEARLATEAERLRSALLSSLSHDLKTPLASITGAITALRAYPDLYDTAARDELAGTIQDEAERLARFVANLLDMTRLQSGAITLDRQPVDAGDIIGSALRRTASVLAGHKVAVALAPDLPMLRLDAILFEQVLVNLLDNAAKFTPPGSTITIEGWREARGVVLTVMDEGPGLPPEDLERVFETFYRARQGDCRPAGTGLGLAICRGFVGALGGTITAANRTDRPGAAFSMVFPEAILVEPEAVA